MANKLNNILESKSDLFRPSLFSVEFVFEELGDGDIPKIMSELVNGIKLSDDIIGRNIFISFIIDLKNPNFLKFLEFLLTLQSKEFNPGKLNVFYYDSTGKVYYKRTYNEVYIKDKEKMIDHLGFLNNLNYENDSVTSSFQLEFYVGEIEHNL